MYVFWLQVMLYSGQLDIIVAAALTEEMITTIDWQHADEYKTAPRTVWKVRSSDTEVAGYVRKVRDFYQVLRICLTFPSTCTCTCTCISSLSFS